MRGSSEIHGILVPHLQGRKILRYRPGVGLHQRALSPDALEIGLHPDETRKRKHRREAAFSRGRPSLDGRGRDSEREKRTAAVDFGPLAPESRGEEWKPAGVCEVDDVAAQR